MIFIDVGLLRSLYWKKISYLLAEEHWSRTNLGIWQPTYDITQCAKIIVGFMANVGNVFLSNVYKGFFFKFSPQRFITSMERDVTFLAHQVGVG